MAEESKLLKGEQRFVSDLIRKHKYQPRTTNCSTCVNSSDWSDTEELGHCNVLEGRTFLVQRCGICRLHSDLN